MVLSSAASSGFFGFFFWKELLLKGYPPSSHIPSRDLTSPILDAKMITEDGKSQGEKVPFWRYCFQELYACIWIRPWCKVQSYTPKSLYALQNTTAPILEIKGFLWPVKVRNENSFLGTLLHELKCCGFFYTRRKYETGKLNLKLVHHKIPLRDLKDLGNWRAKVFFFLLGL